MNYREAFINGILCVKVDSLADSREMLKLVKDKKFGCFSDKADLYREFPYYRVEVEDDNYRFNAYTKDYIEEHNIKYVDYMEYKKNELSEFKGFIKNNHVNILHINRVHKGAYLSYYEVYYSNIDGKMKKYEMVSHNPNLTIADIGKQKSNGVMLIVFNEDKTKLLLIKEFRMGVNNYVYGVPGGFIDKGEDVKRAVERELKEETGLDLIEIDKILNDTYVCAPITDMMNNTVICRASGEIREIGDFDSPDEEIYSKWYSKDEVKRLLELEDITLANKAQVIAYCWAFGI